MYEYSVLLSGGCCHSKHGHLRVSVSLGDAILNRNRVLCSRDKFVPFTVAFVNAISLLRLKVDLFFRLIFLVGVVKSAYCIMFQIFFNMFCFLRNYALLNLSCNYVV